MIDVYDKSLCVYSFPNHKDIPQHTILESLPLTFSIGFLGHVVKWKKEINKINAAIESYSRRSVRRNPCLKIIVYRTLMWNINNVQLDQKLGSYLIYWLQVNTGVIISSQHHRTKEQNRDNSMTPFSQKGKMAITITVKQNIYQPTFLQSFKKLKKILL